MLELENARDAVRKEIGQLVERWKKDGKAFKATTLPEMKKEMREAAKDAPAAEAADEAAPAEQKEESEMDRLKAILKANNRPIKFDILKNLQRDVKNVETEIAQLQTKLRMKKVNIPKAEKQMEINREFLKLNGREAEATATALELSK